MAEKPKGTPKTVWRKVKPWLINLFWVALIVGIFVGTFALFRHADIQSWESRNRVARVFLEKCIEETSDTYALLTCLERERFTIKYEGSNVTIADIWPDTERVGKGAQDE